LYSTDRYRERRDMAQDSLLRKLDEALGRIRLLERERNETMAKLQSLEKEASELRSLISLAESKMDEILKPGSGFETSKTGTVPETPKAANASPGSKGLEQLMEASPSQQEELRKRFPHAFTSA
jgi:chromosome segregation ATPase